MVISPSVAISKKNYDSEFISLKDEPVGELLCLDISLVNKENLLILELKHTTYAFTVQFKDIWEFQILTIYTRHRCLHFSALHSDSIYIGSY